MKKKTRRKENSECNASRWNGISVISFFQLFPSTRTAIAFMRRGEAQNDSVTSQENYFSLMMRSLKDASKGRGGRERKSDDDIVYFAWCFEDVLKMKMQYKGRAIFSHFLPAHSLRRGEEIRKLQLKEKNFSWNAIYVIMRIYRISLFTIIIEFLFTLFTSQWEE